MNKSLSLLSDLEEFAFYGFPDFNDEQRSIYFAFEKQEWNLISTCPSLRTQVYCTLQIGYFKAKNLFFPLHKTPQADIHFILSRYFENQTLSASSISKYEYYFQRKSICLLFGYRLWSNEFLPHLYNRAKHSVQRDISPNFIAHELLDFLQNEKIVRPHYSTLQKVISKILTQERHRLKSCLQHHLTEEDRYKLDQLLKNENTLSALSALKQDAKNFKFSIMKIERKKYAILEPLYDIAQESLSLLSISQQNIAHYANLKKEIINVLAPGDLSHYQKFLIPPAGQIDQDIILDENESIDRVIATLALKEVSQSTLIKKLCSLSPHHNTRKAIFEFDKLCRGIYTLKCALNPEILSNSHRSQNRIESYHTLRAAIAKAGGRKALLGRTDLEVEVSNQCGRLIAIAIIYYNASIHSRLLENNPTKKQLNILKKYSPAAWRHIHFTGNFTFYTNKKDIDIDHIIEHLDF